MKEMVNQIVNGYKWFNRYLFATQSVLFKSVYKIFTILLLNL